MKYQIKHKIALIEHTRFSCKYNVFIVSDSVINKYLDYDIYCISINTNDKTKNVLCL